MGINIVTGFTHKGREYSTPISLDQRKRFVRELTTQLEEIDGVTTVSNAGTTSTWDSVRLEVELELEGNSLVPNPRVISPRIRTTLDEFVPISSHEVIHTPTPVNTDENLYRNPYYIIELWFY
jgi:hypothetical protein